MKNNSTAPSRLPSNLQPEVSETLLRKARQNAQAIKSEKGIPLNEALDILAKRCGFPQGWHELTAVAKRNPADQRLAAAAAKAPSQMNPLAVDKIGVLSSEITGAAFKHVNASLIAAITGNAGNFIKNGTVIQLQKGVSLTLIESAFLLHFSQDYGDAATCAIPVTGDAEEDAQAIRRKAVSMGFTFRNDAFGVNPSRFDTCKRARIGDKVWFYARSEAPSVLKEGVIVDYWWQTCVDERRVAFWKTPVALMIKCAADSDEPPVQIWPFAAGLLDDAAGAIMLARDAEDGSLFEKGIFVAEVNQPQYQKLDEVLLGDGRLAIINHVSCSWDQATGVQSPTRYRLSFPVDSGNPEQPTGLKGSTVGDSDIISKFGVYDGMMTRNLADIRPMPGQF